MSNLHRIKRLEHLPVRRLSVADLSDDELLAIITEAGEALGITLSPEVTDAELQALIDKAMEAESEPGQSC